MLLSEAAKAVSSAPKIRTHASEGSAVTLSLDYSLPDGRWKVLAERRSDGLVYDRETYPAVPIRPEALINRVLELLAAGVQFELFAFERASWRSPHAITVEELISFCYGTLTL